MARVCTILLFVAFAGVVAPASAEIKKELPKEVVDALKGAEQFELYTLNPADSTKASEKSKDYFHGWRIVDHKSISDARERAKLADAFVEGTKDAKGAMRCFKPRHGLRLTHGNKHYDFVLSFECLQSIVFEGNAAEGFTIRHRATTASAFDIAVGKLDLKVADR
jgi:hypothetical protein